MEEEAEGVEPWVLWVLVLAILGAVLVTVSLLLPPKPDELSVPAIMFAFGMMSLCSGSAILFMVLARWWRPGRTGHPKDNRWQAYKNETAVTVGRCVDLDNPSPVPAPEGWSYVKPCHGLAKMGLQGGILGTIVPYFLIYFLDPIWLLLAIPMSIAYGAWALLNWPRYQVTKPLQEAICKRFKLDFKKLVKTVETFHQREGIHVDLQFSVYNQTPPFPDVYNASIVIEKRMFVLEARALDDSEMTTVLIVPYKEFITDYAKGLDEALVSMINA